MATKQIITPSELRNPDGLSKDHINAIIHYLGRLKELDPQAAMRAVRYVVNGGDEEILLKLGGMKKAAEALLLGGVSYGSPKWEQLQHAAKERAAIFRSATETPGVWIRLGQVFDAIRRAAGSALQTPPGWPSWLVTLVVEVIAAFHAERHEKSQFTWTVSQLEAILAHAELPADLLARAYLDQQAVNLLQGGPYYYGDKHSAFTGWDSYLAKHVPVVREALARQEANHRLYVLRTLGEMHFDFSRVVDLLVQLGTSSSKTVRDAVLPLLSGCAEQARPLIEGVLANGDASERNEAALLLWRVGGRETAAVLQQRLANEPSERVKQTIEKLLAAPEELSAEDARQLTDSLPPVRIELGEVELPAEAKTGLREFFDKAWQQAMSNYQKQMEQWLSPDRPKWMSKPSEPVPVSAALLEELCRFVEGKTNEWNKNPTTGSNEWNEKLLIRGYAWQGGLGDWLMPPGIKLIHVVRLDYAAGILERHGDQLWWREQRNLEAYRGQCKELFGLRELDAAVATLPECKPTMIARTYLSNNDYTNICDWEPDAIWPLFAEHPEVLHEILVPKKGPSSAHDYSLSTKRQNVFKVLAMFPQLPAGFIPLLWDIALGEAKSDRAPAQAALATVPNKAEKVLVALARWQANHPRRRRRMAGQDRRPVGDRATQGSRAQGETGGRQGRDDDGPRSRSAPTCRSSSTAMPCLPRRRRGWRRSGLVAWSGCRWIVCRRCTGRTTAQAVDPRIVQWWVVQSIQQKSPVCGSAAAPLPGHVPQARDGGAGQVRADQLDRPGHAHALARGGGGRGPEGNRQAMGACTASINTGSTTTRANKDNLYRELFTTFANKFLGSAIEEKGMLAIVAAAGDARVRQAVRAVHPQVVRQPPGAVQGAWSKCWRGLASAGHSGAAGVGQPLPHQGRAARPPASMCRRWPTARAGPSTSWPTAPSPTPASSGPRTRPASRSAARRP